MSLKKIQLFNKTNVNLIHWFNIISTLTCRYDQIETFIINGLNVVDVDSSNDIDVKQNSNDEINDLNHEEDLIDLEEDENPPDNDLLNDENINKSEIDDNSIVSIDQYKTKQVYAGESDYDRLIYPLLFWNGEGGCGKLENEVKFNSQLFRYSIISICMQHPDLYINKCSALKEEFICSAFGRKI